MPDLVVGTLREGFQRVQGLTDPAARAMKTMLVVTEVHPFTDGNGRMARLAMNWVLTAAGLSRFEYGTPRSELRERLSRCNVFQEDLRSYRLLFPEGVASA